MTALPPLHSDPSAAGQGPLGRRLAALALLGFSSGLPNLLTQKTLGAWLTVENVDIKTIGLFSVVGLPYALKFLWAPLMDRYEPPLLGRRRGWLLLTQVLLIAGLLGLAFADVRTSLSAVAGLAFLVALVSASQDIVGDAYRTDVLTDADRGRGAATWITGYRVAMIVAYAGVLTLVGEHVGWTWQAAYTAMAGLVLLGVAGTILAPPDPVPARRPPRLVDVLVPPFRELLTRRDGLLLLLFVVLFKLPDMLSGAMTSPFLLKIGFSVEQVGWVTGLLGIAVTIAGTWLGGWAVDRFGLWRMMWVFALLHSVSNLGFWALSQTGPQVAVMVAVIVVENLCVGLATAGFFAFLMDRCHPQYSASQFAGFTSLMALGGVVAGSLSGLLVEQLSSTGKLELAGEWGRFFLVTVVAGLPGLALLPFLSRQRPGAQGS